MNVPSCFPSPFCPCPVGLPMSIIIYLACSEKWCPGSMKVGVDRMHPDTSRRLLFTAASSRFVCMHGRFDTTPVNNTYNSAR